MWFFIYLFIINDILRDETAVSEKQISSLTLWLNFMTAVIKTELL